MTNLSWDNYPNPTLVPKEGKWYVRVSIPTAIRHCFGSGGGNNNNRAKSTGTNDKSIAQRKMQDLAHKIYKEFDEAQLEYSNRNNRQTDKFAEDVIYGLADLFKYNKGMRPTLVPSTDYDELAKMKESFDSFARLVADQKESSGAEDLDEDALQESLTDIYEFNDKLNERLKTGQKFDLESEQKKSMTKLQRAFSPNVQFDSKQVLYLEQHSQPIVQSYWQDLLTQASIEQGKTPPIFDEILDKDDYIISNIEDGHYLMGLPHVTKANPQLTKQYSDYKPISRPRRNIPKSTQSISDILNEYFLTIDNDSTIREDTRRKKKRGVRYFIKLVGNLPLQEIRKSSPRVFADKLIADNRDIYNKTINDHFSAMRQLCRYLCDYEIIESNPFLGFETKKFGKKSEAWLPYTKEELFEIFNYDWAEQEYLLLSILVTTGMRLNEATSLTWERFNDTEFQGIRYFTTIDTDLELVRLKNDGSKRIVPLHSDLVLPPKGTGRLFDYYVFEESSSKSSGEAINPTLKKLVPHRLKSAHSLRGTLKGLLRDADVTKEINDFYTGHGQGDASSKSYGAISVPKRFEAINAVRHPWLKRVPE